MKQIEHDPDEPRIDRSNFIWWAASAIIGVMWLGNFYLNDMNWGQIGLGFMTGVALTAWAIERSDNKAPW